MQYFSLPVILPCPTFAGYSLPAYYSTISGLYRCAIYSISQDQTYHSVATSNIMRLINSLAMSTDVATKPVVEHEDYVSSAQLDDPGKDSHRRHNTSWISGFATNSDDVPPGYFRSAFFLGTMAAICFSLDAGVAGYTYAAPLLSLINEDIGPVRCPIQFWCM